jgi:hypothetical protein
MKAKERRAMHRQQNNPVHALTSRQREDDVCRVKPQRYTHRRRVHVLLANGDFDSVSYA